METDRHKAILVLIVATIFIFFGCLQEMDTLDGINQETLEERGEPPQLYDPLGYMYHELVAEPEDYQELFGCSPPEMSDHCEGQTRYYDFECIEGEWQFKLQECTYECNEGACINTGCPPCADGNPCTTDFCSNAPNYECVHVPIAGCGQEIPSGQKGCSPVAGPGSYIVVDVYPAGAPTNWTNPTMSQKLLAGEKMWVDEDDSIYFDYVYLQGTCPECYYPPILQFPPSARLIITKDLAGEMGTYLINDGESGYMCIEGKCTDPVVGHCLKYVCGTSMRFEITEMNFTLECS